MLLQNISNSQGSVSTRLQMIVKTGFAKNIRALLQGLIHVQTLHAADISQLRSDYGK